MVSLGTIQGQALYCYHIELSYCKIFVESKMEMNHSGGSFLLTRIPLSSFFVCVLSSKGKDIENYTASEVKGK